jgi:pSer/pThr/pTyr-binding forkhead associated (FHA) protein
MNGPDTQDTAGHELSIRIFMSHSNADNVLGVRLAEDLRRVLGDPAAVWYDSSGGLHPGAGWWQTIIQEVAGRPIFLVIWSPAARDSKWVNDEVDLAWQQKNDSGGKTIIPLIWHPCELRADLRTRQAISFSNPDEYDERFTELLAGLRIATDLSASALQPAVAPFTDPTPGPQMAAPDDETIIKRQSNALLLLSIDGRWPPTRVPIRSSEVTLGRESGNDVLISDPAVSRFHVCLLRQRAGWKAETQPGAKPMHVNGEQRETAMLGHGDQIVIGGTVLRLEQPEAIARATTIKANDVRTVLASGLMPDLAIETQQFRFTMPLRAHTVTVGRAPDSALVIPSPLVSAHQAVIRRLPDGHFELESSPEARNSFTLDGNALKRHVLRNGDVLTLGSRAQNQYVSLTYLSVV